MTADRMKEIRERIAKVAEVRGCSDGSCCVQRPSGMHTNGGCKCVDLRPSPEDCRRLRATLDGRQKQVAYLLARLASAEAVVEAAEALELLARRIPGDVMGIDAIKACFEVRNAIEAHRARYPRKEGES